MPGCRVQNLFWTQRLPSSMANPNTSLLPFLTPDTQHLSVSLRADPPDPRPLLPVPQNAFIVRLSFLELSRKVRTIDAHLKKGLGTRNLRAGAPPERSPVIGIHGCGTLQAAEDLYQACRSYSPCSFFIRYGCVASCDVAARRDACRVFPANSLIVSKGSGSQCAPHSPG